MGFYRLGCSNGILPGHRFCLAYMTEASNMWTFRFRLARIEHWWWTAVTVLLAISLSFDILSSAKIMGNEWSGMPLISLCQAI